MRREGLLRHLRRHGCVLRREGKEHTLWEIPQTGHAEAVPRHAEIANLLARKICRKLSIPDPPGGLREGREASRLLVSVEAPVTPKFGRLQLEIAHHLHAGLHVLDGRVRQYPVTHVEDVAGARAGALQQFVDLQLQLGQRRE